MDITAEQRQMIWTWISFQITTHPETHDQANFEGECGTTRCVAGWAVFFFAPGYASIYQAKEAISKEYYRGDYVSTAGMARDVLGLDWDTASDLFYGFDNDQAAAFVAERVGNGIR